MYKLLFHLGRIERTDGLEPENLIMIKNLFKIGYIAESRWN